MTKLNIFKENAMPPTPDLFYKYRKLKINFYLKRPWKEIMSNHFDIDPSIVCYHIHLVSFMRIGWWIIHKHCPQTVCFVTTYLITWKNSNWAIECKESGAVVGKRCYKLLTNEHSWWISAFIYTVNMFPCHFEIFLINIQIACCKVLYHTKFVTYILLWDASVQTTVH